MTKDDIKAEAARIVEAADVPFTKAMQAYADIVALVTRVAPSEKGRRPMRLTDAERARRAETARRMTPIRLAKIAAKKAGAV